MATSAVFDLIDALVPALRTALPSVTVYDGWGNSDEAAGDFVMIGIEDADVEGAAFSADARQEWATAGSAGTRDETGEITCLALSWNGNSGEAGARQARASLKATTAAVENVLRANPSLGVDGVLWTGYGSSTQLTQDQSDGGAMALVVFRIAFRARI